MSSRYKYRAVELVGGRHAQAFCKTCSFSSHGATRPTKDAARIHTAETGHTTLTRVTQRSGFEGRPR